MNITYFLRIKSSLEDRNQKRETNLRCHIKKTSVKHVSSVNYEHWFRKYLRNTHIPYWWNDQNMWKLKCQQIRTWNMKRHWHFQKCNRVKIKLNKTEICSQHSFVAKPKADPRIKWLESMILLGWKYQVEKQIWIKMHPSQLLFSNWRIWSISSSWPKRRHDIWKILDG